MESYKIEKLPDLLTKYLEPNTQIKDVSISKLSQGGYLSIMLKIDVKLKNKNGKEELKHLVAKVLPSSEELRKALDFDFTFKKEVAFYKTVLPALKNFVKENSVEGSLNFFPKFYGGRINLDGNSDVVTDDAVLVLENLIEAGYQNLQREEAYDLETTKSIFIDVAKFHGTMIGLKLKHPKLFTEKIKPLCDPMPFGSDIMRIWIGCMEDIFQENSKCAHHVGKVKQFFDMKPAEAKEPYATMAHCDLWMNNIMLKTENGTNKNMIVDYQLCDYRSCASDIFFFLWTNVQHSVLQQHLDTLIAFYHDQLLTTLRNLNCDTSAFSLEKFYEELKTEAGYEFGHAFLFVFAAKNPLVSVTDVEHNKRVTSSLEASKKAPKALKELMWFMILECDKRGWLY